MDVILKQDVDNLGFEYEVVSVKPGYGRNFLIPQGMAVLATPSARAELDKTLESRKAEEEALLNEAQSKADALKDKEIKIVAKAGDGDKLFGSVNNADVAKAIEKQTGVDIDKKYIKVPGNTIKRTGHYQAKVRLHRNVEAEVDFDVVAE